MQLKLMRVDRLLFGDKAFDLLSKVKYLAEIAKDVKRIKNVIECWTL